jgi:ACT domain-containing protein
MLARLGKDQLGRRPASLTIRERPRSRNVAAKRPRAVTTHDMTKKTTIPRFSRAGGRAIVTIIGSDRVGIIAGIANVIAEANVNILDISQSVIREFFTMIMMVDLSEASITFEELTERLAHKGRDLDVRVEIQREEIFKVMHRV